MKKTKTLNDVCEKLISTFEPMTEDEVNAAIMENVASGDAEIIGYENGEPLFRLTEKGRKNAEALILSHYKPESAEDIQ